MSIHFIPIFDLKKKKLQKTHDFTSMNLDMDADDFS